MSKEILPRYQNAEKGIRLHNSALCGQHPVMNLHEEAIKISQEEKVVRPYPHANLFIGP